MDRQKKLLLFGAAWVSALLLTWFYWSNIVILVGAEFNSELLKASRSRPLPLKEPVPMEQKRVA